MMQPSEKKPINKIWSHVIMFSCFLFIVLLSYGVARSFKAWLTISFATAFLFILVLTMNAFVEKKKISILYTSILAPMIIYPYIYFINLFLTIQISYIIIFGGCSGSFTGVLLASRNKEKINKYGLIGVILYYILIGYISFRYVVKYNY